jgi:MinD superfamily P-loop ATPase
MKTMVVISGKGGSGKTSITAGLVPLVERGVFVDADVDAANMSIALRVTPGAAEAFFDRDVARIDAELCTACGSCLEACRFGAVRVPEGEGTAYRIDEISCEGCAACSLVCPSGAVSMRPSVTGEWSVSETPYGPLVHAELDAGGQNSGGLVQKVRQEAERLARARGRDVIMVDGPAGTGCPVISALAGADAALVVAEPTPSGVSDLLRAFDLAAHFGITASLVINKADLNAERRAEIERLAADRGVPVLERLPYDQQLARTAREGWLASQAPGPWRRRFENIWRGWQNTMTAGPAGSRGTAGMGEGS